MSEAPTQERPEGILDLTVRFAGYGALVGAGIALLVGLSFGPILLALSPLVLTVGSLVGCLGGLLIGLALGALLRTTRAPALRHPVVLGLIAALCTAFLLGALGLLLDSGGSIAQGFFSPGELFGPLILAVSVVVAGVSAPLFLRRGPKPPADPLGTWLILAGLLVGSAILSAVFALTLGGGGGEDPPILIAVIALVTATVIIVGIVRVHRGGGGKQPLLFLGYLSASTLLLSSILIIAFTF